MATLVFGAVGTAIGGPFGGAILGFSGAAIGGFIGSTVGSVVDSWIVSSLAPAQRIEGARLDTLRITSATEGAVIPRLYGRMRIGGNIIWATDFREETKTTMQGGGKGGGGGKVKTTEYLYYASFAVALCEGPIPGIGHVWADGKAMDMTGVTWRWYPGNEAQTADPFIAAKMGAANTPAYRGTAYVVFEDLALATFGNRLPQLSFEVFRPLADPDTAEGLTRAVTLIPASGEFTYATLYNTLPFISGETLEEFRVVSLLGGVAAARRFNPAEFASQFAELFQGDGYLIAAPAVVDSPETKHALLERCGLALIFEMAGKLDDALLSVGGISTLTTSHRTGHITEAERRSLIEAGAVGDVFYNFIVEDGTTVGHEVNDRLISADLNLLRRCPEGFLCLAAKKRWSR